MEQKKILTRLCFSPNIFQLPNFISTRPKTRNVVILVQLLINVKLISNSILTPRTEVICCLFQNSVWELQFISVQTVTIFMLRKCTRNVLYLVVQMWNYVLFQEQQFFVLKAATQIVLKETSWRSKIAGKRRHVWQNVSDYVSDLGNNNLQLKLLQRKHVQAQKLLERKTCLAKCVRLRVWSWEQQPATQIVSKETSSRSKIAWKGRNV